VFTPKTPRISATINPNSISKIFFSDIAYNVENKTDFAKNKGPLPPPDPPLTLFSLQLKAKIQYMYRQFAHVTLPIVTKRPEPIVPIITDNTTAVNSSLRFLSTQM